MDKMDCNRIEYDIFPVIVLDNNSNIVKMNSYANQILNNILKNKNLSNWDDIVSDKNAISQYKKIVKGLSSVVTDFSNNEKSIAVEWKIEKTEDVIILRAITIRNLENHLTNGNTQARISRTLCKDIVTKLNDVQDNYSLEKILLPLVHCMPHQANLKSGRDFTYVTMNGKSAKVLGVSGEEVRGKKVEFINRLPTRFISQIYALDESIVENKQTITDISTHPFLDCSGKIVKLSMSKIPVFDAHGNVDYIFTFAANSLNNHSPEEVRASYLQFYKATREAHSKFLQHYGLDIFENEQGTKLSEREIDCLLSLRKSMVAKRVARELKISYRTVEVHLENIRDKMKCQNKNEILEKFFNLIGDY